MYYYTPYIILPFFSSLVAGILAFYLLGRRNEPTVPAIMFVMFLISLWSCVYGLQTAATEIGLKSLFYKVGTTCSYLVAPTFLAIAMEASGFSHWMTRRRLLLIGLAPLPLLLAAWTMEFHSLNRYDLHVVHSGPLLLMGFKSGPLYITYYIYVTVIFLLALVFLGIAWLRGQGAYRHRSLLLFIGTLLPVAVDNLNITPYKWFSLVTSTFWFTGICYALAIFRFRLLEVLPFARSVLFENLSQPILILDSGGNVADSNRAACELFMNSPKKKDAILPNAVLKRFPLLEHVTSSLASPFLAILSDAIEEERYWQVTATPLNRKDYFLGSLIQFYDVTELKRTEETLRAAQRAAEEANRIKSDFLAMVSHELRTPLQAIIGFSDLGQLLDEPRRSAEYLAIINDASLSLLDLVNNVLDLSRIDAGALEIANTRIDLPNHLHNIVVIHAHQAEQKDIAFSMVIDEKVPRCICGDPLRLRQILANIIGNAVKFTNQGSVTLEVTLSSQPEAAERTVGMAVPLRFTIRDTGIGIPEDKKGLIFEEFAQADSIITRRYGGSGLGTAIARRLARLMGGDITFESWEGKGSVFVVELTFATAAEQATASPAVKQVGTGRPLTILLAEDNLFNQRLLVDALALLGHSVSLVPDGREAVAKFQEGGFDLVLLDLMMPVIDGFAAARLIRASEAEAGLERTPIVALSANTTVSARKQCLASGMDDIISKPFTLSRLNDLLGNFSAGTGAHRDHTAPLTSGAFFDPARLGSIVRDPLRLASYCELLLKDLERELGKLADAFSASDRGAIVQAAHAIKGATLSIRGSTVSALAARLQNDAENGSESQLADSIDQLRLACSALCETLKNMRTS